MSAQSETLLRAIGELDGELVLDAAPLEALPNKRARRGGRWLAAALLAGTAFAARQWFGSWIVNVEHDGAYYTQKAYSGVRRFTAGDFAGNILFSPEGEGFWYVGLDGWDEMEDYLGWPLPRNTVMDNSPSILSSGGGEPTACVMEVRYCEHGTAQYRYRKSGRDMSPYADGLEYVNVQSSALVDGVMVTLKGSFFTELDFAHTPYDFPFHGEEFPAGTLSEYALPNGGKAVVFHPAEGISAPRPEAWFVYEGALYYIILSDAPGQDAPEGCPDYEAVLCQVLDGFR